MTPTYDQQFQKITSAYLNNILNPFNECACFVGNLLNGKSTWGMCRDWFDEDDAILIPDTLWYYTAINFIRIESCGLYTPQQIVDLENNFLNVLGPDETEESLFEAMTSTLELLRQIHISKGEDVDEIPLIKRTLLPPKKAYEMSEEIRESIVNIETPIS